MMKDKIKLQLKINRARYNLMFMAILSVINIIAVFSTSKLIIPFSSAIATYSSIFGIRFGNVAGNNLFTIIGLTISALAIIFILICYFKSKSNDLFFAIAFGFTVTDTVCLVCFSAFIGYLLNLSTFLDIALHIVTIVYLFGALKAFRTVSKTDNGYTETSSDADDDVLEEYTDDGGEVLLEADYDNYNIVVVENENNILLVVNGYICNSTESPTTQDYELSASVNGVDIIFVSGESDDGIAMSLYANNELIAKSN